MKISTSLTAALFASSSVLSIAGEPAATNSTPVEIPGLSGSPDFMEKIKFKGDIRARYEFRDQDGFDEANALTVRARLGLEIGDFNGFSAYVEGEGSTPLVDDYASNPVPGGTTLTDPYEAGSTVIADPETLELNQAYVKYAKNGFAATVGRQRIIRNNAAFIGNVGWRQNEQTYDAAQLSYAKDDFSVSYVFANRVQRIFGSSAPSAHPLHDFEGDFHFFDIFAKTDIGKVGAYAYIIDLDPSESTPAGPINSVGDTNTFGAFIDSNGFYAEVAYQDGTASAGPRAALGDYDAMYSHLKYSTKVGGVGVSAGVEYLENGFVTPLATVHAFNGFADSFIANRIGLPFANSNYDGLTDFYAGLTKTGLPGGITFKGFLHYYMDDSLDNTYGYEADMVLVKKLNDSTTALLKAAYFVGEDFYQDIKQVSVQLDYKF